ncbi:MAG: alpha-amylase [Clostridiales bacterium]|nr:alpha-amylase [Clostridiales bacterium]
MINGIMFQAFEWYMPTDGNYYREFKKKLDDLKRIGVTAIWLPPVTKAISLDNTGYGIYDLYDLGEFDQKKSKRTKYGTKEELLELIDAIKGLDMQVYADVVINHKAGADYEEEFMAVPVDWDDRTKEMGEYRKIRAWTGFDFPGRANKHSDFKWNFNHFTGVDFDSISGEQGIYKILGENKDWNWGVSAEKGNYDYLMFADIDHAHPEVKEELKGWIDWFIKELSLDGIRLDAVKHIDKTFMEEFSSYIYEKHGKDFYLFGEYWDGNLDNKMDYMSATNYRIDLLDVSLHYNFFNISKEGADYDLTKILKETVVSDEPLKAVTFVDNHDTQFNQSLESYVETWFKEIAYGLILLRKDGFPCIFYGDYYGIGGEFMTDPMKDMIDKLALVRKNYAFGDQDDYFMEKNLIGFLRHGNEEHPNKMVAVISITEKKTVSMFLGEDQKGKVFEDITGNTVEKTVINEEGYGNFIAEAGKISVYIEDGLPL